MKYLSIAFLAFTLWPTAPATADAGVSQRIQSLSLHIEKDPDNQTLHLRRALAYLDDNQPELALSDVQVAESLADPVAAAYTHGLVLYRQGNYTAARPYFDRYLYAYPEHWGARDYRARLLRDLGLNRQALADYEVLIGLNDDLDPGYYVATARLMAQHPDRGVDDALALLDNRIAQRGAIAALQRAAIDLERQRGNFDHAIARMAKLDGKLRATPQWQLEVAELLVQAQRAQEALPYLAVAQEQLQASRATVINQALLEKTHLLRAEVVQAADQNASESPSDGACSTSPVDSDKPKVVNNGCNQPD